MLIAVDLGASSGRVLTAQWDGAHFDLAVAHRFANGGVSVGQHLYWDILRIWEAMLTGLRRAVATASIPPSSVGIDSWAVDFALLDAHDELLGNPHHYRDLRTQGMLEWVDARIGKRELFERTGIQFLSINTLYQLAAMRQQESPALQVARHLLMIPDVLNYWLTGERCGEYTNASTTMCFDCRTRTWARDVLERIGISSGLFPPIQQPGAVVGPLLPSIQSAIGAGRSLEVVLPGTHDTASAVAAVPNLDDHSAYLSSGTWSLLGVEIQEPITTDAALAFNLTNEGGVGGKIRLLKNVTGLWLLQRCQEEWARQQLPVDWGTLLEAASYAPALQSLIDPDAAQFVLPDSMPAAICNYCIQTGQPAPDNIGAIVRCCLESLALKYRYVLEGIASVTGRAIDVLRVVGGGSQNAVLCQFTADALQRPVVAGPVEATALGNVLVQAISLGLIPDLASGRAAIAQSVTLDTYTPRREEAEKWEAAYLRFKHFLVSS
ncbi:MAG: rhamnulokinase [Chloroflexi bacterium]|nr:rhamnulokinase [Chloroflexota bacterium]